MDSDDWEHFSMSGLTAFSSVRTIIFSRANWNTVVGKLLSSSVLSRRDPFFNWAPELGTPVCVCEPDASSCKVSWVSRLQRRQVFVYCLNSHWMDGHLFNSLQVGVKR